ncbi:spidroin-1-like [Panicum virgatum]|uniref:spidroin-1-like n=1 Tax=Panicum virgatum TaxID=38727 RepID=UPI0019D51BD4|nr:spidroin-1-like [Panicum virgatum]
MAAEVNGDGGAPVTDWQGEGAGELRGSKAELARRSWGSGRVWSCGSTVGRDSSELEEDGGGVCTSAKKPGQDIYSTELRRISRRRGPEDDLDRGEQNWRRAGQSAAAGGHGVMGSSEGGVARGEGASRGGGPVAGILCLMRGAVRQLGEKIQWWLGSPELQNRGGELTAPSGGGEKRQRGVKWGQGESGRLGGTPNGGAGGRWVRKIAAASGGAVPAKRVVEERFQGLMWKM